MICLFSQAKSNAQNANQRRKWAKKRNKSTVPVPVLTTNVVVPDTPPFSQSDNSENAPLAPKVEKSVIETDRWMKLPRAMRKSPNGGGLPLGDMNGSKPDEPVNKESEVIEARTPVKQKRTLEKENNGR